MRSMFPMIHVLPLLVMFWVAQMPMQAQVATPGLMKVLQGQKKKALQAKVATCVRQIGLGLAMFESDYNSLPDENTAKVLKQGADDGAKLAADSANDIFFQLLNPGYIDNAQVFTPLNREAAKIKREQLQMLDDCFFSYIPAKRLTVAGRPLVVAPLIKGKKIFDQEALGGKAVVMLSDMSVHLKDIDENGSVMLNGKDLFDPKQPYWDGKEPMVKWPE